MLSKEQVNANKNYVINLIKSITIDCADISGLLTFLESSDFFTAPATSIYHHSYEGGLCEFSISVYNNLCKLVDLYATREESSVIINNDTDEPEEVVTKVPLYSRDTLIILGLLSNISKVNYYEKYIQNKKVYREDGYKQDNLGKFDWESSSSYKVKDASERYLCADSSTNAFMVISRYIPLTEDETISILNQNCGMDNGYANKDLFSILSKSKLTNLLHCANMISSFVTVSNE